MCSNPTSLRQLSEESRADFHLNIARTYCTHNNHVPMVDTKRGPCDCDAEVGLRLGGLACQGNEPIPKQLACSKQCKQVNATVCTPAIPPCIIDFAWTHGPGLISVAAVHRKAPCPCALWHVDVWASRAHKVDMH
jgi:hypothetical protein